MFFLARAFDLRLAGRRHTIDGLDAITRTGIRLKRVFAQHGATAITDHTNVTKVDRYRERER
jgi:hypothetical protein